MNMICKAVVLKWQYFTNRLQEERNSTELEYIIEDTLVHYH